MVAESAASPSLVTVSADTQEVRFATTMTGGVSLAIWMGGVTRELDLLLQASRWREANQDPPLPSESENNSTHDAVARYRRLIDFMDVLVDTDVVSGTSAGGINGILLAMARVRGLDLGKLRDIWLEIAALETLIRDPGDSAIPSLLYGDEQMLSQLNTWLDRLPPATLPTLPQPKLPPTRLYVTTTLLTGESNYFTDSFGTLVQESDHHGVITFTSEQLANPATIGALALAGRSTASFPGAFEPSFLPFDSRIPAAGDVPVRPAMHTYANITRDHWVADGGILNNQPINLVLRDIFRRSASGPVRRVLLFVVPSAGPAPETVASAPEDSVAAPYGLVDGLLKDLSSRMHASITDDLLAIREHNDQIDARSDLRRWIADKHAQSAERLVTPDVLLAFGEQVGNEVGRNVARSMMRLLSSWSPPQPGDAGFATIPVAWANDLQPGAGTDGIIGHAVAANLTDRYQPAGGGLPVSSEDLASYGRPALDGGLSIALDALRSAEALAQTSDDRLAIAILVKRAHEAASLQAVTPVDRLTFDVCADLELRQEPITAAAAQIAKTLAAEREVPTTSWPALAEILNDLTGLGQLAFLSGASLDAAESSTTRRAAALRFRSLADYLWLGDSNEEVSRRLFDLAVTERALRPIAAGPQQRIDLVQVSADTASSLTERMTAGAKLTGMQLHHFGAFYKKSWRANDWMWGRLDGAGWLVHVLLDPARIRHVVETRAKDGTAASTWFLAQLERIFFGENPGPPDAEVQNEVMFLDNPDAPLPSSLPNTSMWLAQAWQLPIAKDELPVLADKIVAPNSDKSPLASTTWATRVKAPNPDYATLLRDCPVPDESFLTDFGTPLLMKTAAKAAATTTGALEQVRQIPGGVRAPINAARTITLGGYRIVRGTGGVAKWVITVGLAVLVASLIVQATTVSLLGGLPMLGALTGGYLIVLGVWQWSHRLLGALIAMTITVGLLALATKGVRHNLFGTKVGEGWLAQHMPWLGSAWWHPLVATAVLMLAISIYAVLLPALPRYIAKRRKRRSG